MPNTLPAAEVKRRGMAAIEEGLRNGPVHLMKRNRTAAIVLSEADYRRLVEGQAPAYPGLTALQWLLAQPTTGTREKADIDNGLSTDRDW